MNLLDAFKQYIRDAMPGGALNPEVTTQGVLDTAALGTAPVPILGDAIGLAADVRRLAKNPEERTPLNFTLAGLGALPFVPSGLAGMFVGKGSKTWDAISAAKASELADKGVDARQIWKETGTFKGPDGYWRQEIDDSVSRLKPEGFSTEPVPRKDVLFHGPLSSAYPGSGVSDSVRGVDSNGGQYRHVVDDYGTIDVGLSQSPEDVKSTLLHELQHSIQQREGWAKGGNTAAMPAIFQDAKQKALRNLYSAKSAVDYHSDLWGKANFGEYLGKLDALSKSNNIKPSQITNQSAWYEYSDKLRDALGPLPKKSGYARDRWLQDAAAMMRKFEIEKSGLQQWEVDDFALRNLAKEKRDARKMVEKYKPDARAYTTEAERFKKLEGMSDYQQYRRLAGEAEARATQARMNLNAAQRRELFPLDSYDVPLDELIVRWSNN